MTRILGIDPGSRKLGVAIIDCEGSKMRHVYSQVIDVSGIDSFYKRLVVLHESVAKIIKEFTPSEVSLESIIHVRNISSLSKLAQARGAVIAACSDLKIAEYSPNLIKRTVSGFGHADKVAILKATQMIVGNYQITSHDQSDAVAIAITHAVNLKSNSKKAYRIELR